MSAPTGFDEDGDDGLLNEADFLIRRHRPDPADVGVPESTRLPDAADRIPTLTDLIAPGRSGAAPKVSGTPPTVTLLPSEAPAAASVPATDQHIEAMVLQRVEQRLEREITALIEQRILPELSGSIDYALGVIKRDLESTLRGWIREAVREAGLDAVSPLSSPASPDVSCTGLRSPGQTRPL